MKIFDELIKRTGMYKHLNDLYCQALRDVEAIEIKINNTYEEESIKRG